jgi:hypothetical protein
MQSRALTCQIGGVSNNPVMAQGFAASIEQTEESSEATQAAHFNTWAI